MGAPRRLFCRLQRFARGALLTLCSVLSVQGALAQSAFDDAKDRVTVVGATYEAPTTRYNHAVLGPKAEWGALRIKVDLCGVCALMRLDEVLITLPQDRVFEDLSPRVVDLDGDDRPEVVVIESHARQGARLAVYGPLGLITATPYIGTGFRWLAPLGAADLDGDGHTELAYIDRPHLAKTLRVWRYKDQTLTQIASRAGLTNHRIGEDFISGGIRDCGQGPEIVTADAPWQRLVATRLVNGALESRDIGPFSGPTSFGPALACEG